MSERPTPEQIVTESALAADDWGDWTPSDMLDALAAHGYRIVHPDGVVSEAQMYLQGFGPERNGGPIEVRLVVTGPFDDQEYRRLYELMKAGRKVRIVEVSDA